MNQTTASPSKRKSGRQADRKTAHPSTRRGADRLKCTLLLDSDTSMKLSVAAHLRGLDRSDLVNELLTDALRYVVISFRGQSNGSAIQAGDVSQAEIAVA